MKKLMIVAAIALAAVGAQASACSWGTGALKTADEDGKWTSTALSGNYSSLSVIAYIYADQAGETILGYGQATSVLPNSAANGTFMTTLGGATKADFTNGETYYVQLVMTADFGNGTQTFLNDDIVAFTMPDKNQGSVSFTNLGIIDTTAGNQQWSAVPEPTSGLLLLLGVAGLALRRRRA